jgi:hypothetical protein
MGDDISDLEERRRERRQAEVRQGPKLFLKETRTSPPKRHSLTPLLISSAKLIAASQAQPAPLNW